MWRALRWPLLWLWLVAAPAWAASPLLLSPGSGEVDGWPATTARFDPGGTLEAEQVLGRLDEFHRPEVPHANFGVQRDPLWLHLPLQVDARDDGQWLLSIDYPPLNEVLVTVWHKGRQISSARLGNLQPFSTRPLPTRTYAMMLDLTPGQQYDVLVRLQSRSSVLAPISLSKQETFHLREARMQLLLGLWFGIALMLVAYSITHWISLRDRLFAYYAALILGTSAFFLTFTGLGQQHLWDVQAVGALARTGPLGVLAAMVAGALFVMRALHTAQHNPRLHRGLKVLAAIGAVAFVATLVGVMDYRQGHAAAVVLGPGAILLALPAAWRSARSGQRVGVWMLLGWSCYLLGVMTLAALLSGLVPANVWTINFFQFTAMLEMLIWLRVLGLHVEVIRHAAEHAAAEREVLESLAHTDALTGLPNRRGLMRALHQARPGGLALYLLDLDGFKPVNDTHGHDVGDALLVAVAQRLQADLRSSDLVGRLGGDEFVVMVRRMPGSTEAAALGDKLLRAFDAPFDVLGHRCRVGATIGYALAPQDAPGGEALLKAADTAMYAGKAAGRRTVRRAETPLLTDERPATVERELTQSQTGMD
ncbi:MAG: sensor domain-containing diguanylate cyclase [Proteobacteria bacterium]|nr:sensor domain-containing diguanylate cyclase [Pseudomonadota bacterium]